MRVDESCKTAAGLCFVVAGSAKVVQNLQFEKNYKLCLTDWVTSGGVNSHLV